MRRTLELMQLWTFNKTKQKRDYQATTKNQNKNKANRLSPTKRFLYSRIAWRSTFFQEVYMSYKGNAWFFFLHPPFLGIVQYTFYVRI
jgi:hypothetical protein